MVGHSYGGAVITEAAAGNPNVKALVYVAAFAPDEGETLNGLIERFTPAPLGKSVVPDSAGFLYIDREKFQSVFANDLAKDEAALLAATQKPLAAPIFGEAVKAPPGRQSLRGTSYQLRTMPLIPTWNDLWQKGWGQRRRN